LAEFSAKGGLQIMGLTDDCRQTRPTVDGQNPVNGLTCPVLFGPFEA
jgi:hypothetical protein